MVQDDKPANWLDRKWFSLLEVLRCLSPTCRRILERTSLFRASRASIGKLEQILSEQNPTSIIFGHLDIQLYPLILSLIEHQRPYGIIAHGCEISRLPNSKTNDFVIKRLMLKSASWIAANSRHTQALLDTWNIPPEKIKVVHPPISEESITESFNVELPSRKDNVFDLVTICRLVRGKGIDLVIHALKILDARGIPYRYAIGGDGPERGSLEALVDDLGLQDKVHFKGSVDGEKKWSLLRNADVFVMPSRFDPAIPWQESFGIAFVEAAAFGVPAVGSRSGGIPDAVIDGETGILVPEESAADLADALTFLYRNPETRRKMGQAASERARRDFSPRAIAVRFREALLSDEIFPRVARTDSTCL
jgi:phosphatidylinositol alpha-1,6-mannosyltransferase